MSERFILHSDANCFYASVEMLLNPKLRGKAVAVCGSTEERHGIVLAKSELAKKAGVKTGQANWEARQACPDLIVVPPQYDQYCKFSKLLRNIYSLRCPSTQPVNAEWLPMHVFRPTVKNRRPATMLRSVTTPTTFSAMKAGNLLRCIPKC